MVKSRKYLFINVCIDCYDVVLYDGLISSRRFFTVMEQAVLLSRLL